jgi:hypothetical protein
MYEQYGTDHTSQCSKSSVAMQTMLFQNLNNTLVLSQSVGGSGFTVSDILILIMGDGHESSVWGLPL